jgi:hypothetical protein
VVVLEISVDYLSLVKKYFCIAIRSKRKLDIRKATQFTSSIARQDVLPDNLKTRRAYIRPPITSRAMRFIHFSLALLHEDQNHNLMLRTKLVRNNTLILFYGVTLLGNGFCGGSRLTIYINNVNLNAMRTFHNARQRGEMPTTPFYVAVPPPTPEAQKSSNMQERVSVKGLRIDEGKRENVNHNFRPSNSSRCPSRGRPEYFVDECVIIRSPIHRQMLGRKTSPPTTKGTTSDSKVSQMPLHRVSGVTQPTGRCEKIKRSEKRSLDRWQARRDRRYESVRSGP